MKHVLTSSFGYEGVGSLCEDEFGLKQGLRESEERFCRLFMRVPLAICVISRNDEKVLEVNQAFLETSGYSRQQLLGLPGQHFCDLFRCDMWEELSTGQWSCDLPVDMQLVRCSGEAVAVKAHIDTITFGQIPCYLFMLESDWSHEQEVEHLREVSDAQEYRVKERTVELLESAKQMKLQIHERKATEECLKHERDFTSAVLDTVGALVMVLDREGRIIRFNRCSEVITGYKAAEIYHQLVWDVFFSEDDSRRFRDKLVQLFNGGELQEFECNWLAKDGSRRLINGKTTILMGSDGLVEHVILVGLDVTNQAAMAAELQHAEKMAVLGRVAAGVAHEIGNPLAFISARLQRLKGNPSEKLMTDSLDLFEDQILRMTRILRSISTFSRMPTTDWVSFPLGPLIDETVKLLKLDRRSKQIEIGVALSEGLPAAFASRDQLQQVFLNLGLNAFDAMPTGGSLDICATFTDRDVRVSFKDSGIGVPREIIDQLFKPFFTTKPEGVGTGIGLSLSYDYIKAHGGSIELDSKEGDGACFTVVLPRREAPMNRDWG